MAIYRAVQRLEAATAAYIAGLIDGEGTVTLTRLHRGENRRIVVCVANNDIRLLEFVKEHAGAGRITKKRSAKPHHAASFNYNIAGRQALELLAQLLPYLRSYKRDRAALLLEQYVRLTPRNGRYTAEAARDRSAMEAAVLAIKPR